MLTRVELENWRSHRQTDLALCAGTNVFVGVMGAGKSSIADAISFALFGKFPAQVNRRVSLEETILARPNPADVARVTLHFSIGEKKYRITREIRRNKATSASVHCGTQLVAGPRPKDANEKINELLGIDFELFSRAIYAEQNQLDQFLRLSPGERKKKFDELLSLERYETARANAAALQNQLRRTQQALLAEKEKLAGAYSEQEAQEQVARAASARRELAQLESDAQKTDSDAKAAKSERDALEQKRAAFERTQRTRDLQKDRLAHAQKEVDAFTRAHPKVALDPDAISARQTEIASVLEKERARERAFAAAETALARLQSACEVLEKQARDQKGEKTPEQVRDETAAAKSLLSKTEALIRETESAREKTIGQKGELDSQVRQHRSVQERFESLSGTCPTCRQEVGEDHRAHVRAHAQQEAQRAQAALDALLREKTALDARHKTLSEERENLLSKIRALERASEALLAHEKTLSQIASVKEQIVQARRAQDAHAPVHSAKQVRALEEESRTLLEAARAAGRKKEAAALEAELRACEKALSDVSFDPAALERAQARAAELSAKKESLLRETARARELCAAVEKTLSKMEEQRAQITRMADESEALQSGIRTLSVFATALLDTQTELRTRLVDAVNAAMDDVWARIYPYRDYVTARIRVIGGDYEMFVKTAREEWVRVEGMLSGGERSAAALAIRVAFSLVLARKGSWLILDEPTHNLDRAATEKLCDMLRDHLPGLVDQVLVITHDAQLERAASAKTYTLLRDKESFGHTRVTQN